MKKSSYFFKLTIFLSLLFLIPLPLFAQFDLEVLEIQVVGSSEQVSAGNSFKIAIIVDIKPEFHINSDEPLDPVYIPTEVRFDLIDGVSFGKLFFPDADLRIFGFSDDELAIFENKITIFNEITLRDNFSTGPLAIHGKLFYQACDDKSCYMPQDEKFDITLEVVDKNSVITPLYGEIFNGWPGEENIESSSNAAQSSTGALSLTKDETRAKEILEKGLIYAIIAFFVFGLALNLTPCVYPVIPITVSYFSGQADKKKGQAFLNALVYVIGIALIFALLGLISGLAGKQWGFLFQNPWFVIVLTVIILAMAASMFGAFEIRVPVAIMNKFGQAREGVAGALFMGLTVGIVIAPCAAGIIIGLVGLVAKLGLVVKGTLLFFIMGLGLGFPYLVLASFSGLLNKLPQSGMWMVWVRKFFGILLVGVELYFFLPQAKHIPDMQGFFFGLLAIFGGLLLGFLDHAPGYSKGFKIGRGVFGIVVIILGIFWTNSAIRYQAPEIDWRIYSDESVSELISAGKPVFIDFYADWCAPCKELDKKTFPDPQVVEKAKLFTMVKVDCTAPDENIRGFMNQFQVTGMPTLVFLNLEGEELKQLREIGFINPEAFVKRMETTQGQD